MAGLMDGVNAVANPGTGSIDLLREAANKKATGGLFGKPLNARKQQKEMFAADLDTMRNDPDALGLTEAQRQTMIGSASQQAQAGAVAQTAQLGRDALAGQGFQQGSFADAARGLADTGEDAAVKATVGVNELHRSMIDSEKARIEGRLAEEVARKDAQKKMMAKMGVNIAGALAGIAFGPAGVAAAGAITGGINSAIDGTPQPPAAQPAAPAAPVIPAGA